MYVANICNLCVLLPDCCMMEQHFDCVCVEISCSERETNLIASVCRPPKGNMLLVFCLILLN